MRPALLMASCNSSSAESPRLMIFWSVRPAQSMRLKASFRSSLFKSSAASESVRRHQSREVSGRFEDGAISALEDERMRASSGLRSNGKDSASRAMARVLRLMISALMSFTLRFGLNRPSPRSARAPGAYKAKESFAGLSVNCRVKFLSRLNCERRWNDRSALGCQLGANWPQIDVVTYRRQKLSCCTLWRAWSLGA
jgi:hypothetical protein